MKILISTIISNDLGPIMRMLPIAKRFRAIGHEVFFCNRASAPALVIEENGFTNYPVRPERVPQVWPETFSAEIWNGSQGMAYEGFLDPDYIRDLVRSFSQLMEELRPDVVVDTWNQAACIAARSLGIPLVTINQADLYPQGSGLIWWKAPPDNLPDPIPAVNQVLEELALPLLEEKVEELLVGDLALVVGTPDTDPLPETADVRYIGSLQEEAPEESLPPEIQGLTGDQPVIWVYSGNPRYGDAPGIVDSIVILRAAVAVLAEMDVDVVVTTGHQPLPEELAPLPENFIYRKFVPGAAMARKADLFIHHGGHGSTLTGLAAGTPALIVPTYSERESNARRVEAVGAGLFVLPWTADGGEKQIDLDDFSEKIQTLLTEPRYRERANQVAARMKAYTGAEMAVAYILEFLDRS